MVELIGIGKSFNATPVVNNISFAVKEGETVCLLGPSGCGKTTTLRMIAGLEAPDSGVIVIDGNEVTHQPPYARKIGLVFQDYALFPHMTVQENISFGLRHRKTPKAEIPGLVAEALELVRMSGYEARRPAELSGGQQQRVAVARALATRPTVLLLDEPLSNLDAKLRAELRLQLRATLDKVRITAIMVTHDQEEAMSVGDRVIVMNNGVIEQAGTPTEIYDAPRTPFVAEFIGQSNWLTGRVVECADGAPGTARFALDSGDIVLVRSPDLPGPDGFDLCLRPERITVIAAGSPRPSGPGNRLRGRVGFVESLGPILRLHILLDGGERVVALRTRSDQTIFDGIEVDVIFAPQDAMLIPRTIKRNDAAASASHQSHRGETL